MNITRLKQALGAFFFALAASFFVSVLHAQPASAAGETYTWKDYRTIVVSGGDIRNNDTQWNFNELYLAVDEGQPGLQGDQIGIFRGSLLLNKGNGKCYFGLSIYVYKGNVQGMVWSPPPYGKGQSAVPSGYPGDCESFDDLHGFLESSYHNKYVDLKGTRPNNPNAPERDDEKRWDVFVFAPDPLSKVPASDTIYIYKSDGTKVAEMSSPFKDDSGAADWPPDQTPASLQVTFKLEPGDYVVCDTYVAKECNYAKAPANQKFKKEKYKSGSISIGKQFLTPEKKRIRGHVEYHVKAPCGSEVNVSPVTIELTGPDGKVYSQQTNAGNAKPSLPGEGDALCTKDVSLGLYAEWNDMPPGQYKACATGAECITFTKPEDKGVEDFTLVVNGEQLAPPNQPVCTSGEGVAGALAWIICPATQIIASATEFFEKNIIVPFMTVSPLTTNAANPVYVLWQNFRDVANLGFVILLFISIFSIALSKYGLKRVMPRLLIVAIGINLSYFAVAFVIDAFNVFGGGISQLIVGALKDAGTTQLNEGTSAGPVQSIFVLGGAALVTILLTGGAAIGWLFSFLGLAALVVVVVVIVLIVRQLAIIMLVILSPIAILMYMLPNTEGWFKKWRQMLIQLLMMYPMIVLLFAAGKIFGIILQQPDFKIAGDGVTDEVAQAVRVILQFLVYVIPLVFLPATFAASGALMGKVYGAMSNRLVKQRAQRLREDTSHLAGEAKTRLATSRIPGVNRLAGSGLKRDYVRASRQRNLQREQEEYLAGAIGGSSLLRRQAAGVAGQAGQTRAAAAAAKTAEKGRKEDLEAERSLLTQEMRRIGMDEATFASKTAEYLQDPTDASKRVITGANGQTFDFAANETRLQRALLDSAASQGHVGAIEAARMNTQIDQRMVDDIIRNNDGTLKGKGGYHLATNFNLAAGRMQVHDPATGALRAPANQSEMENEILAQRLVAMAQTGANSIANMKGSLLDNTSELMAAPSAKRTAVLQAMDHIGAARGENYRTMLQGQIDKILTTPQTLAQSDLSREGFQDIRNNL